MKAILFSLAAILSFSSAQSVADEMGDAREAAVREVGRIIGRKIGYDIVRQMSPSDRKALLDRERAALRGALLFQYAFQGSTYRNQMQGYIMVTREGVNTSGRLCRELEMDLIFQMQEHFELATACLNEMKEWEITPAEQIHFPPRGANGPDLTPGRGGGWLPPVRP
ncbi:MAG: hypothetical protein BroJett040_06680 [Oligoflexia bacterium]|nr:MAG: hypothetical protein BroJett040_06680 [Oligoflexia bacterium]